MNSYLTPQNIALGVVYLRNSRAHVPDKYDSGRLDGNILSRNLLRPELIIASFKQMVPQLVICYARRRLALYLSLTRELGKLLLNGPVDMLPDTCIGVIITSL